MNPGTGFCLGCYRTMEEICRWRDMTDDDRRQVMNLIAARRAIIPVPAD